MELFKKAYEKQEVDKFLQGNNDYKCRGISDVDDPVDYLACWENEIIPYINADFNFDINVILEALKKILNTNQDVAFSIYTIIKHINWYYYFRSKNLINKNIKFNGFEHELRQIIERNSELLKHDKRWAGADWNSANGLWDPIVRTAKYINEVYNGVNFIPG